MPLTASAYFFLHRIWQDTYGSPTVGRQNGLLPESATQLLTEQQGQTAPLRPDRSPMRPHSASKSRMSSAVAVDSVVGETAGTAVPSRRTPDAAEIAEIATRQSETRTQEGKRRITPVSVGSASSIANNKQNPVTNQLSAAATALQPRSPVLVRQPQKPPVSAATSSVATQPSSSPVSKKRRTGSELSDDRTGSGTTSHFQSGSGGRVVTESLLASQSPPANRALSIPAKFPVDAGMAATQCSLNAFNAAGAIGGENKLMCKRDSVTVWEANLAHRSAPFFFCCSQPWFLPSAETSLCLRPWIRVNLM